MENNPLKQYFRRPAVYIRLPSGGKGYPNGTLDMPENGELPVYPMTAIDEISNRTPDGLYNGSSVVEMVKSCVPNIKNPWAMSALDLDTILLSIRAASGNSTLEIDSTCPKCREVASYGLEIPGLLSQLKGGDYDTELQISDLTIKFKPITFKEVNEAGLAQFELTKSFNRINEVEDEEEKLKISRDALKGITELTMKIVTKGIEYIKTPNIVVDQEEYILDFLMNCDKGMYVKIRDYSTELKAKSELQPIKIVCDSCQNQYEQSVTINPSDFFA
jgi:hypothetical protein